MTGARVAVASVLLAACANSGILLGDDDGSPPPDGAPADVTVLPLDSGPADVAVDTFDAGCAHDAALGGIGIPAGSTASATTTYQTNTPTDAIDGDFGTYWNSGGFTGSITVSFASATALDGVRLFVSALPTTSETYTVFGLQNGNPTQIGQSTQTAQQSGGALSTIAVTPGSYDAIRIDVNGNQSWVAINEISLTTTYCP